jgi:hypothetical protein
MKKYRSAANLLGCKMLYCILGLLVSAPCLAQVHQLSGIIRETFSQEPLPFVHIVVNNGTGHYYSDIDGLFHIQVADSIDLLEFKAPGHRTVYFHPLDTTFLEVNLNRTAPFVPVRQTDAASRQLMQKVMLHKNYNNPQKSQHYTYKTYNKFTLTTDQLRETKTEIQKLLRFMPFRLKEYRRRHHLFLMETVTKKQFYDQLRQYELIEGARASGIDSPSLLTLVSFFQPFTIYERYISLASLDYVGPLSGNNIFRRYNFQVVDTAFVGQDTLYTVQYNPKPRHNRERLKGYMYINSNQWAVQYTTIKPAVENSFSVQLNQQYKLYDSTVWIPEVARTHFHIENLVRNISIKGTSESFIDSLQLNTMPPGYFNEVSFHYDPTAARQDSTFWQNHRPWPLSAADENTYAFYDTLGRIRNFERLLRSGRSIYLGSVPIRGITIDLNRVLNFNESEGIRAGLGLVTNERFSRILSLGAYYGWGVKDEQHKWGLQSGLLLHQPTDWRLTASISHDLQEPGSIRFAFDKVQYWSEPVRRFRLTRLDMVNSKSLSTSVRPFQNIYMGAEFNQRRHYLPYEYQFRDMAISQLDFTEARFTFRQSFGERFITSDIDRFTLGTSYPEYWIQLINGIPNSIARSASYHKFDVKVQQSFRVLGWGRTGWQLRGGYATGTLPYPVLYNEKGSFRNAALITHNSFETMYYNEFLHDRYMAIHLSHDVGRLYEGSRVFQPSLEFLHNMGFGSLRKPEEHQLVDFKTMEKGYYETGFFTNDFVVLNLYGVRVGAGAGWLLRWGPYAMPRQQENLFFKFATNFSL